MFPSMQAPRIDLFEWLIQNAPKASYNLAFSNIHGVTVGEYQALCHFSLPDDFDLGPNAQYGASVLKDVLCSMYRCSTGNIVTTTGASEANFLVFSSLLTQGDEFIVEQPGYQPMWSTPEMLGARKISWQRRYENRFSLDVDSLQSLFTKKTKMVVITNLHNPSGIFTNQDTIQTVAEIAQDHGAYVLIDEIFLDGSFLPRSSSFGIPNVIVTSSATKIYWLGGLNSGWVVAPKEVAEKCQKLKAHTTGAAAYTSEVLTAALLRKARMELLRRFQERAKTNYEFLKSWVTRNNEILEWVEPDGGILCFLKYSVKAPSVKLCSYLCDTQKVLVNPGTFFGQDGFLRVSYGGDLPVLRNALDALERGLRNFKDDS
jgi:aspartate/methionine/tyrosine aminotransferase